MVYVRYLVHWCWKVVSTKQNFRLCVVIYLNYLLFCNFTSCLYFRSCNKGFHIYYFWPLLLALLCYMGPVQLNLVWIMFWLCFQGDSANVGESCLSTSKSRNHSVSGTLVPPATPVCQRWLWINRCKTVHLIQNFYLFIFDIILATGKQGRRRLGWCWQTCSWGANVLQFMKSRPVCLNAFHSSMHYWKINSPVSSPDLQEFFWWPFSRHEDHLIKILALKALILSSLAGTYCVPGTKDLSSRMLCALC